MSRSASATASLALISVRRPAPTSATSASSSSAENLSGLLPARRIIVCSIRNSPLMAARARSACRNPETNIRKVGAQSLHRGLGIIEARPFEPRAAQERSEHIAARRRRSRGVRRRPRSRGVRRRPDDGTRL